MQYLSLFGCVCTYVHICNLFSLTYILYCNNVLTHASVVLFSAQLIRNHLLTSLLHLVDFLSSFDL